MKRKASRALTLLSLVALLSACRPEESNADLSPEGEPWKSLRDRMVAEIEANGVRDERVLEAMRAVPRHRLVPRNCAHLAYEQSPLPIGENQTISSPYIVGKMTEHLELDGTEKVLEIGTGSGYQAAVLARLVPMVYTIEIRPNLAKKAKKKLARLGYDNVIVRCGDGYQGWAEEAPFDAIIVTAAPLEIPEKLEQQLALGGRMVVPVGRQDKNQVLKLITKDENGVLHTVEKSLVRFVPMVHPK